jgi:hypothetical protein
MLLQLISSQGMPGACLAANSNSIQTRRYEINATSLSSHLTDYPASRSLLQAALVPSSGKKDIMSLGPHFVKKFNAPELPTSPHHDHNSRDWRVLSAKTVTVTLILTIKQVFIQQNNLSITVSGSGIHQPIAYRSLQVKLVSNGPRVKQVLHNKQIGTKRRIGCEVPVHNPIHTNNLSQQSRLPSCVTSLNITEIIWCKF